MVYCSHCGTQNRDGSKFCNNCGARLVPESGLRCPMCSTPNPVENVFCLSCGARLVPLTAAALPETKAPPPPIKGLSLPAKPEATDESTEAEEPAEPTEPEGAAPLAAEDLPDWIARLRGREGEEPSAAEESEPPEPTGEGNAPDWMTRLREAQPPEDTYTYPPEPQPEDQVPDWMKESSEEPPAKSKTAPAVEEEIPDWLRQPQSEETEPATEPPPSETEEPEKPDWLTQPELTPQVSVPPGIDEKQLPDWLKSPTAEPKAEAEAEGEVKPEEKTTETTESTEATKPAEVIEPEQAAEPLIESLEESETTKPLETPPSIPAASMPSEEEDLPDWLRTSTAAPTPEIEPAQPGEVPAWVAALKPAELSAAQLAPGLATDQPEMSGPLEGLRGVLPLAVAIAEPHKIAEAPKPSPSDGGKIFESILATPPQPAAPAAKPPRFVLTMRPFIYGLLLLAVLVPFLLPYDLTQSTFDIAGTPAAEFFDTLQKIPANSTVLLSFDYDPSLSGEMDLQATAIARDLVKRGVKIIAVSTLDTGPQMAQRILDPIASQASNYNYGTNYLIVYLPGHEAGLAQLATAGLATTTDFVDQKSIAPFLTAARIRNLSDLSMVIELAGTEEPLKTWVEQVQPRTGVRIAAAVSAAVEPKARAYRNSLQLTAMMAGLLGAAQFEALDNQPGLAVISVNAQTAAQLVIVFFIVLGNIVFWISRARGTAK
jgi:Double zinc ribbon